MKKFLYVLLTLSLIFTFSCKEEDSSLSVDKVVPSDLADYTDNGLEPSDDGIAELAAAGMAGYAMGDVMESWISSDPDLSAYFPSSGAFGLTKAITEPSDDDYNDLMTAMNEGGSFSITASVVDELIDFSDYGEAGSLTLNASVSADGDISDYDATSGTDTISGDGEFSISGSSIDTENLTMAAVALNLVADIKVVHTFDSSSESMSVNANSALVYAFSLSDIDFGDGSIAPSGKYIYTLTVNEQVDIDLESDDSDVDVSATISLVIYDNSDTEIASYTFDSDDLETAMADF